MPSESNAAIPVSPEARQVILGSVLGDGSLEAPPKGSVNYGLTIKHGLKQEGYCLWKAGLLGPLVRKVDYPKDRVRVRCVAHPAFTALAPVFGPRGTLTREALDELEPLALAVWYLDDGSLTRPYTRADGRSEKAMLRFCTNAFPREEVELMRSWFHERFGLTTTLCSWRNPHKPEQPYLGIRLYADQAESFLTLVSPYVGQHPTLLKDLR